MPKTTTNAFDLQWKNSSVRKASYRIQYKRRYSSGSAYVWEASWTTLKESDVLKVGQISWKLADAQGGSALASNFTLALDNKREQWNPSNTMDSKWKSDTTALVGYEPYLTQWQVLYGYLLADGTFERMTVFTGYSEFPQFESGTRKATFNITGREIMLEGANAQAVVTTLTNQVTTDAGDGSRLIFPIGLKSVWNASQVRVGGSVKTQGTDYTLSDMNDADKEGKITFLVAPANLAVIDFNGQQWKRDQQISTLVGLLCDEAGITSGERSIEEPIFGSTDQSNSIDTKTEFQLGVSQNINDIDTDGEISQLWYLADDFATGDTSRWQAVGGSVDASSFSLVVGVGGELIKTMQLNDLGQSNAIGTWDFTWISASSGNCDFALMTTGTGVSGDGYTVTITSAGQARLSRMVSGAVAENIISGSVTVSGTNQIRVTRTTGDLWELFYKPGGGAWASVGTATDSTFSQNAITGTKIKILGPSAGTSTYDDIFFALDVFGTSVTVSKLSAVWESDEIDMLTSPTAWLPITEDSKNDARASFSYSTKVSTTSGSGFDTYVSTDGTNTPTSNLKRYLHLRVTFTDFDSSLELKGASIQRITLNWRSSSLFIAQADFSGQDCMAAIKELGKLANMDFGFNGDGTFFFRNKTDGSTADFTLTESNAIAKVTNLRPGYKEVKNIVQVRYGGDDRYYAEYKSSDAGESFPTSQDTYNDRILSLSFSRFLFSNSASVSDAIAAKHYNGTPRRRATLLQRITPQMDLSDTVSARFLPDPRKQKLIYGVYGDDMQDAFPFLFSSSTDSPSDVTLQAMLARVIGIKFDIENRKQTTEIIEIL